MSWAAQRTMEKLMFPNMAILALGIGVIASALPMELAALVVPWRRLPFGLMDYSTWTGTFSIIGFAFGVAMAVVTVQCFGHMKETPRGYVCLSALLAVLILVPLGKLHHDYQYVDASFREDEAAANLMSRYTDRRELTKAERTELSQSLPEFFWHARLVRCPSRRYTPMEGAGWIENEAEFICASHQVTAAMAVRDGSAWTWLRAVPFVVVLLLSGTACITATRMTEQEWKDMLYVMSRS